MGAIIGAVLAIFLNVLIWHFNILELDTESRHQVAQRAYRSPGFTAQGAQKSVSSMLPTPCSRNPVGGVAQRDINLLDLEPFAISNRFVFYVIH